MFSSSSPSRRFCPFIYLRAAPSDSPTRSRARSHIRSAAARRGTRDHRQRSFAASRHARLESSLIRSRRRRMTDRMNGCAQRGACARVRDFSETVMHPQPLPSCANKPRTPKVRQVPRDGGLRQPKRLVNVADTHLAVREDAQNPKPRRIAQRAVHPRKFMDPSHCAPPTVPCLRVRYLGRGIARPHGPLPPAPLWAFSRASQSMPMSRPSSAARLNGLPGESR